MLRGPVVLETKPFLLLLTSLLDPDFMRRLILGWTAKLNFYFAYPLGKIENLFAIQSITTIEHAGIFTGFQIVYIPAFIYRPVIRYGVSAGCLASQNNVHDAKGSVGQYQCHWSGFGFWGRADPGLGVHGRRSKGHGKNAKSNYE
jgi:hypothetical protein